MQCFTPVDLGREAFQCIDEDFGRRRDGSAGGRQYVIQVRERNARSRPNRSALYLPSQRLALRPVASLARPGPRTARGPYGRGAGSRDVPGFNGKRPPGCHPGAAFGPFHTSRGTRPMKILPLHPLSDIDATEQDREPTDAELDAIDAEMPLIRAEVEELDVRISLMDRPVTELDARRLRRARRKVLAARRELTNQTRTVTEVGA
ncbi:predicted protein [Streptomyces viridochromogenes DSM 40736]|uniref:Predicted protein n=2 Tax=Streptomyces viridochromogenes TaxID=1938 RepID=D9X405_STRVT|nr:predicted protein [Streptomyces viridochromogenes DSM 40736]